VPIAVIPDFFKKQLSKLYKKYPNSKKDIMDFVENKVPKKPLKGDRIPGFGFDLDVRKIRFGLKKYKISARDGIRFIYLNQPDKERIIAISIYLKSTHGKESKNITMIKSALKSYFNH
jgi:hypothetical protein